MDEFNLRPQNINPSSGREEDLNQVQSKLCITLSFIFLWNKYINVVVVVVVTRDLQITAPQPL